LVEFHFETAGDDTGMQLMAPELETVVIKLVHDHNVTDLRLGGRLRVINYSFFAKCTSLQSLTIDDTPLDGTHERVHVTYAGSVLALPKLREVTVHPDRPFEGTCSSTTPSGVTSLRFLTSPDYDETIIARTLRFFPRITDLHVASLCPCEVYARLPDLRRIHVSPPGRVSTTLLMRFGKALLETREHKLERLSTDRRPTISSCSASSSTSSVASDDSDPATSVTPLAFPEDVEVQWDGWAVKAMGFVRGDSFPVVSLCVKDPIVVAS
jgi:hypothetical protein